MRASMAPTSRAGSVSLDTGTQVRGLRGLKRLGAMAFVAVSELKQGVLACLNLPALTLPEGSRAHIGS